MSNHAVVVCGYGCHLVPELQKYLDRVIEFANKERPEYLVMCGGFTQRKSAPGISEAALMKSFIIPRLSYTPDYLFLEEDSYTTPDNIERAAKLIRFLLWTSDTKLTVFCEATRALKVDDAVRYYLSRRANLETSSWELMSPTKQIISMLYDWAAIRFSPLAHYLRNKRIRRAEQI